MSLCYTSQSLFPFALVIWLLPWTLIILLSVVREDDPRVDTIFIVVLRVKKHSEPEQNDERCKDAGFGQAKKQKNKVSHRQVCSCRLFGQKKRTEIRIEITECRHEMIVTDWATEWVNLATRWVWKWLESATDDDCLYLFPAHTRLSKPTHRYTQTHREKRRASRPDTFIIYYLPCPNRLYLETRLIFFLLRFDGYSPQMLLLYFFFSFSFIG